MINQNISIWVQIVFKTFLKKRMLNSFENNSLKINESIGLQKYFAKICNRDSDRPSWNIVRIPTFMKNSWIFFQRKSLLVNTLMKILYIEECSLVIHFLTEEKSLETQFFHIKKFKGEPIFNRKMFIHQFFPIKKKFMGGPLFPIEKPSLVKYRKTFIDDPFFLYKFFISLVNLFFYKNISVHSPRLKKEDILT